MNYPEYNKVVSRLRYPKLTTSDAFTGHEVLSPADCVSDSIEFFPIPGNKPVSEPMAENVERLTKHGSKLARTALVQCTLAAKRYSPYLKKYYDRIKSHRGSSKAIIATARKLLNIIFDTLKNDWVFEDFPNFVLASSCVKK